MSEPAKQTIDNHPICEACKGQCCQDWEWYFCLSDETRALMADVGESGYMNVRFWQRWLNKRLTGPPRLKILRVVYASPHEKKAYMRCRCLEHNRRTGRCRIYHKRPETCREFPNASNVKHQVGWGCPLIDVLAAKPAPENHEEFL